MPSFYRIFGLQKLSKQPHVFTNISYQRIDDIDSKGIWYCQIHQDIVNVYFEKNITNIISINQIILIDFVDVFVN